MLVEEARKTDAGTGAPPRSAAEPAR
jgi:hypothetical protein